MSLILMVLGNYCKSAMCEYYTFLSRKYKLKEGEVKIVHAQGQFFIINASKQYTPSELIFGKMFNNTSTNEQ